jgi:hypothetical protein
VLIGDLIGGREEFCRAQQAVLRCAQGEAASKPVSAAHVYSTAKHSHAHNKNCKKTSIDPNPSSPILLRCLPYGRLVGSTE